MRDNAAYYKLFMDASTGGATRRNPKRKTTGSFNGPATAGIPSAAEIDAVFETHLKHMSQGGTWGDNMEISAFSAAYKVDVKIYQTDLAYMVTAGDGATGGRQVVHLAYHVSDFISEQHLL